MAQALLKRIYYDASHPASFSGVKTLFKAARKHKRNISRLTIEIFLEKQPTYTLHKNVRKRFKRRKILAKYVAHIWETDLIDLQAISAENRGNRYILTAIDVLSRYAFAQPIKDKKSSTIIQAFKKLFQLHNRKPTKIHSDRGKEFTSK